MMRSIASERSESKTWKTALCSESTGSNLAPLAPTSAIINPPAQTRHSLLASATTVPRRIAASVGASPAAPTIAAMTHSAGKLAASVSASAPAAAVTPVPERPSLSAA